MRANFLQIAYASDCNQVSGTERQPNSFGKLILFIFIIPYHDFVLLLVCIVKESCHL